MAVNVTSNLFAPGYISRLREAILDVFILRNITCSLTPPEPLMFCFGVFFLSFLPGTDPHLYSSPPMKVCSAVITKGTKVNLSHSVSCGAMPLVGGRREHTGVFWQGTTLTQVPLTPLGYNIIATSPDLKEMGLSRGGLAGDTDWTSKLH